MKTKTERVTQDIGLWAIPKRPEDMVRGELPFSFELYGTTTHWRDEAIFVAKVSVTATVPEGVDLMAMAHQTLDQRADKALKDYQQVVEQIEQNRKKLYMLAAPQETNVVPLYDGADFIPANGEF